MNSKYFWQFSTKITPLYNCKNKRTINIFIFKDCKFKTTKPLFQSRAESHHVFRQGKKQAANQLIKDDDESYS